MSRVGPQGVQFEEVASRGVPLAGRVGRGGQEWRGYDDLIRVGVGAGTWTRTGAAERVVTAISEEACAGAKSLRGARRNDASESSRPGRGATKPRLSGSKMLTGRRRVSFSRRSVNWPALLTLLFLLRPHLVLPLWLRVPFHCLRITPNTAAAAAAAAAASPPCPSSAASSTPRDPSPTPLPSRTSSRSTFGPHLPLGLHRRPHPSPRRAAR
jgi:hypothetical protein